MTACAVLPYRSTFDRGDQTIFAWSFWIAFASAGFSATAWMMAVCFWTRSY